MGEIPTDQELIARANRGDETAMQLLYERYKGWVMGSALQLTGREADAADVTQEVFLYLFGKFPGFTLTCRLKTFLFPVVRHLAFKQKARSKRTEPMSALLMEPAVESAPPPNEEEEALRHAVSRLPESQRDVLLLRFGDDFSLEEIAAKLAIPLGTVKSRLHNALKRLRG